MSLLLKVALPCATAAVLGAAGAAAQAEAAAAARPDPADPQARVPALRYASPLRGYQAFNETPLAPWRDSNERVRQRGGWKAYAREGREPAEVPAAASPASAPASAPAHHGMHGQGAK